MAHLVDKLLGSNGAECRPQPDKFAGLARIHDLWVFNEYMSYIVLAKKNQQWIIGKKEEGGTNENGSNYKDYNLWLWNPKWMTMRMKTCLKRGADSQHQARFSHFSSFRFLLQINLLLISPSNFSPSSDFSFRFLSFCWLLTFTFLIWKLKLW